MHIYLSISAALSHGVHVWFKDVLEWDRRQGRDLMEILHTWTDKPPIAVWISAVRYTKVKSL